MQCIYTPRLSLTSFKNTVLLFFERLLKCLFKISDNTPLMSTLEIIFEKERCRALITANNQTRNDCVTEKIMAHLFEDKNKLPEIIETLKPLYKKNMRVIVTIPSQEAMTHEFELDGTLKETEVMQFLSSKSVLFFGYLAETLCLDYDTFRGDDNNNKQKITVIAAHRSLIQTIQAAFQKLKFPLHCIKVSNNSTSINLLPWRQQQAKRKKQKQCATLVFFAIVVFIVMIVLKYQFLYLANHYTKKTQELNSENSQIVLNHPHQHIALLQQLKSMRVKKTAAIRENQLAENLFKIISTTLPNSITLSSLYFNSHALTISGVSDQLSTIHTYSDALQQNQAWKKMSISEIHNDLQNKSQMDFTIQVKP